MSLPENIKLGQVELYVQNLKLEKQFYVESLGLEIISETSVSVLLGYKKNLILKLIHNPDLDFPVQNEAGLYHVAIVFSDRSSLANILKNSLLTNSDLFQGSADHLVSEAFYFADPEGNGVELYFDKPENDWQWNGNNVVMGSVYIDPIAYISTNLETKHEHEKKVGHIHLKVGDLAKAKKFYVEVLGFDITAELGNQALFVSKNKYHHHLGLNTWESFGAEARKTTHGLKSFEILLNSEDELTTLKKQLAANKVGFIETKSEIEVEDPWKNVIIFKVID